MRVLVTGATGFIGSHVCAALQGSGHQIRVLVRTPSKLDSVTARTGVDTDALATTYLASQLSQTPPTSHSRPLLRLVQRELTFQCLSLG